MRFLFCFFFFSSVSFATFIPPKYEILEDVSKVTPNHGDIAVYNGETKMWEPKARRPQILSTSDLKEGNNLYYTDERVEKKVLSMRAEYLNSGTTDSTGRIIFNLTKDGTPGGANLFSNIKNIQITGVTKSITDPNLNAFFTVEDISSDKKILTVRGFIFSDRKPGLDLSGAGYAAYVQVVGLP